MLDSLTIPVCETDRPLSFKVSLGWLFCITLMLWTGLACAANPLVQWKERLFGSKPAVTEAPKVGVIGLDAGRAVRVHIGTDADQADFPKGKSRFRKLELQREFEHVALRIQVIAQANPNGRGNAVFKPIVYVLKDDGSVRESKSVEPLHLDIRPFQPTRLLACIPLEKVRHIALATPADAPGKSYESNARDKVKAPTQGGFHYTTDPIKVNLPYIDTGELVVELIQAEKTGEGC